MRRFGLMLISILLVWGCEPGAHTIVKEPAPKAWTNEDIDALIAMEEKSIHSPAPTQNGQPPTQCDEIRYLSFAPQARYESADAILLLSPGMEIGIGGLSHLAKNLIYAAKIYHDKNIEALIVERRGNCLEDLTGLNAAETSKDIQIAIDYYYNAKPVDGKIFEGFMTSEDVPYLSEFGVKLNIEDIYTVITTEVPDSEVRRQKLFLVGHSLSGFTLATFAGWDFDGDPATLADAGYRNCAGLIALDTLITADPDLISQLFAQESGESDYAAAVADLRSGKQSRIFSKDLLPESFMLTELAAMQADWAPDEESSLLKTVPYSEDAASYLKTVLSGTYRDYMRENVIAEVRCTNLALSGLLADNNFNPFGAYTPSMGSLGNGAVANKNFPTPDILKLFPQLANSMQAIVPVNLYYPTGKGNYLYDWINFDEIRRSKYTTQEEEVVDIHDYLKTVYKGPSNYYEWYVPNRHVVDVMLMGQEGWLGDDNQFYHTDFESKVRILEFYCQYGMVTTNANILRRDHIYLKGYNHTDIVLAAANRLERRPNEVIEPLIEFMFSDNYK